jgi:ring-1,2-phenylacetyl-CoA epoxidase subunit PaaC
VSATTSSAPLNSAGVATDDLCELLLRLGDSSLILAQRLGEWIGHAPAVEEDLALSNTALDLVGQARAFLTYAGELEGRGRDEDALAFLRDTREYRNVLLVEQPNGDFGVTLVRQCLFDLFQRELFSALSTSADQRLAHIARKALTETAYHVQYSRGWVVRLGDGTDDSHSRAQQALDDLWRFTGELFTADAVEQRLTEAGVLPSLPSLRQGWLAALDEVLREATLIRPADGFFHTGGKQGHHGEGLGRLLAEMQFLQRAYPGASW